jgi:cell division protein FtsW
MRALARPADGVILCLGLALLLVGFVAISSASVEYAAANYGDPLHHSTRHLIYILLGLLAAAVVYGLPLGFWFETGWVWLFLGLALLLLVLIPGIGREVNGSRRWLVLGPATVQVSEFAKFFLIVYLAGYLQRREEQVRSHWQGFVKPMAVVFAVTMLLMVGMALLILLVSAPYRMQRLTAYRDPWADQFDSGYQLTQSLIAFGRGEWIGVGLGNSVQKLFYLPEAHTDFVFAIWAEETGLIGAAAVIVLYLALIYRVLWVSRASNQAGDLFGAHICHGVALVFAAQVFINIGVSTGLLPTKGLTLPLLSYGGSSLIVCCCMLALVLRVDSERRVSRGQRGR